MTGRMAVNSGEEYRYEILSGEQVQCLKDLLGVFSEAFEDPENYDGSPSSDGYLSALLESAVFIAITAVSHGRVIGGLAAYELPKFEEKRKEIFIYDLAVDKAHRRKGVSSGLIKKLQGVAAERGAHVIFVQADPEDEPAVLLYERFGRKQKVYHFALVTSGQ